MRDLRQERLRELGHRVRALRKDGGLTGAELADRAGVTQPTVSKIETGRMLPSSEVIERLVGALGVDEDARDELLALLRRVNTEVEEFRRSGKGALARQEAISARERQAEAVECFQCAMVPSLLQTAEYARRAFAAARFEGEQDIARAVAARVERQSILYQQGRRFSFVLTEGALRRFVGYDVQYFAAVEPQRRLAPHLHMAIRGTISRAELRQVVAATYTQVWWPPTDTVKYAGDRLPYWDVSARAYLDPDTHAPLTTWEDALKVLDDEDAEPLHVGRFGRQIDAQGVMAGTPDSDRCIGYITKYLVKDIAECHEQATSAQADHADRLLDALRYEPCSPACANWLRYGIQPKNPKPGLTPGYCRHKAHRREYFGYAGRRVLVSRKWSGKTMADHKTDRKNWVLTRLAEAGVSAIGHPAEPGRYAWELAPPDHPDVGPIEQRLLTSIAERLEMRRQLDQATATADLSATQEAA
jgi:transcriptional regulator with XRE-family HTH domain